MLYRPDQAARVCYAAIRQMRQEDGRPPGPEWDLLPPAEMSWYLRAVERVRSGWPPRQVHGELLDDLTFSGWQAGAGISHAARTHPMLAPWHELPEAIRREFFVLQMVTMSLYLEVPVLTGCP